LDRLASERMIEIHADLIVADIKDDSLNAVAVVGHHLDGISYKDLLVVELAIDIKGGFVNFHDIFVVVLTESLIRSKSEIERVTFFETLQTLGEFGEHTLLNAKDEAVGLLVSKLHHRRAGIAIDNKNLIRQFNVFAWCDCFHKKRNILSKYCKDRKKSKNPAKNGEDKNILAKLRKNQIYFINLHPQRSLGGEIGRRAGFRYQWGNSLVGSSPISGTEQKRSCKMLITKLLRGFLFLLKHS
jgi:hypothetical protein